MAVKQYFNFIEGKDKIDFFAGQHCSEPTTASKKTTNKVIAVASFLIGKEIGKAITK